MASLLIKNIPPELHARLKQRAVTNRRSLNSETIHVLEEAVSGGGISSTPPVLTGEALASLPADMARRLRALQRLGGSLGSRGVDFKEWKKTAKNARR